jgi:glyoxylase-like metal-dependent hydrolase (beta-lactamase superfamily II)
MTPPSGAWTDLGRGVRVRQSRVYWMNSAVLTDRDHTVIVDPGVLPSELDDLAAEVASSGARKITLILTHGDWDHVLGVPWWREAAVLAHDRLATEVTRKREAILASASKAAEREGERWERGFEPITPALAVSGLKYEKLGPWRVVLRDAQGHSPSMLSIHLPEHHLLIAADMLSDIEIPIVTQTIAIYRETLAELAPLAENGAIETLIPGHGGIARSAVEVVLRIRRDLGYLDELERRVREAHAQGLAREECEQALEAMEYLGKTAAYSMAEYHRKNVRLAFDQCGKEGSRRVVADHAADHQKERTGRRRAR